MRSSASHLLLALLPAIAFSALTWSCGGGDDPPHDEGETFPLEGMHEALPCEACHGTDGFEALPTECASCHADDEPPDHYEGDCGECHNAFGWRNFGTGTTTGGNPHDTTFPLINAHDLDCASCHVGDDYTGLDPECASCHADDLPNAYHYPGSCAPCHTETVWADGVVHRADLPHHNAQCSSCHPDAANRKTITCISGCHAENVTEPLHTNVGSYVYESDACADCHFPP